MSWFRVDDKAAFHRKIIAAGNEACGAFFRAGAWSSGEGTNGFIPLEIGLLIAPQTVWDRLVAVPSHCTAGLAEEEITSTGGVTGVSGWRLHDFLDYNPEAGELAQKREALSDARRRAGAAGGVRSGESRRSKPEANREAKGEANPKQTGKQNASKNEAPSHPIPSHPRESARALSPRPAPAPTAPPRGGPAVARAAPLTGPDGHRAATGPSPDPEPALALPGPSLPSDDLATCVPPVAPWAAEHVLTVELSMGRRLEDIRATWTLYALKRTAKCLSIDRRSWLEWVTRELNYERRSPAREPRIVQGASAPPAYEIGTADFEEEDPHAHHG